MYLRRRDVRTVRIGVWRLVGERLARQSAPAGRLGLALQIHLLGQMCLESGDEVVPASALPGRQGRIAFAYLVLCPHPASRDEVADVVWPDELPKSWERDLSAVVSKLKALLSRV